MKTACTACQSCNWNRRKVDFTESNLLKVNKWNQKNKTTSYRIN